MKYLATVSLVLICGCQCATRDDVRQIEQSVIRVISKHQRASEHPFSGFGRVVKVTRERIEVEHSAIGANEVIRYYVLPLPHHDYSPMPSDFDMSVCLQYRQYIVPHRTDGKQSPVFKVGQEVGIAGNLYAVTPIR